MIRDAVVIQEDAVAVAAAVFLRRQRDQIAESAVRQRVLIGEEPVVRIEPDVRPTLYGLGQDEGAECSRERGGHVSSSSIG